MVLDLGFGRNPGKDCSQHHGFHFRWNAGHGETIVMVIGEMESPSRTDRIWNDFPNIRFYGLITIGFGVVRPRAKNFSVSNVQ